MTSNSLEAIVPASRVCAVVVLYHAELKLLQRLIESALDQVEAIALIDNTPSAPESNPCAELAQLCGKKTTYIRLGKNLGIAKAQNVGMQEALDHGFTHVLLLDQDSVLGPDTVSSLYRAETQLLAKGMTIAAVGATYADVKTNQQAVAHRYGPFYLAKVSVVAGGEPLETDWLIASGSLIRCLVLRAVGLMREDLFIDLVDAEWGLRARTLGYLSYLVPKAPLTHSIGDDSFSVFGKQVTVHKEVRLYYYLRNLAYLVRVPHMGWRWRTNVPLSLFLSFCIHSLHAENRTKRARVLLQAIGHGLQGKLGPFKNSSV